MKHKLLSFMTCSRWIEWTCWLAMASTVTAATLTKGTVHPGNGNLTTVFKFSLTYQDPVLTNLPQVVYLILDETTTNVMSAADASDLDPRDGKVYTWSGTLPMARHRFRFATVPASAGDLGRHVGPDVSDAPLLVRPFYYFLHCPADYLADDFYVDRDSRFIWAGDLNGDGCSDLVHTWYGAGIQGNANEGAVMIYYGPDFARSDCLLHPRYPAHEGFGQTVAGGGDLDGDGYGDLVVGSATSPTRFFVYHGRASGPPVFAQEITASGNEEARALVDVNRDGYADLVTLGSATVCNPPGYPTVRLRVRQGPALSGFSESNLGVSGHAAFVGVQFSVVDRNGDKYPDFFMGGALLNYGMNSTSGTWHATSEDIQIRCADGPSLGVSQLYSKSVQPGHSYDLRTMIGIGDANGDGNDDFAVRSEGNWWEWGSDWYAGPSLAFQSKVALPSGGDANTYWIDHFGAGDGTGSGRASLMMLQYNSGVDAELGGWYCWGPPSAPFSSHQFIPCLWSGSGYAGAAHDTDKNGLDDFFIAGIGSPQGPLDQFAAMTLGTVLVGSPCYPYPLSEADLPARYRARMAGCKLDLGAFGKFALSPNGSLEFVAGPADTNHLAPLILLANTLQMPDKPIGHTTASGGDPVVLRVRATGEDGSGYIYTDGPNKGRGQLRLSLTVQIVQLGGSEIITASDTMLAKVDLDPPLNLATGYGTLVSKGLLLGFGLPSATLTLAGYVEYVRPTESPFLMRVPARADFGGVCVGSNSSPQRLTLCNLGEIPLHITGVTIPGAPFRITGAPALPATVNPTSALVLTAEYLPTAAGHHEASLSITSDDPAHPTATVLLSGSAIVPGEKDSDGDGLPDSFETRYAKPTNPAFSGLSTNLLDGPLDNDHDGSSNLDEYFAGTDPTDAASIFKLVSARRVSATDLQLNWLSVTGKTYSVCRSTNLLSGYLPIQTGIAGNGSTNTYIDPTAANRIHAYFYRVRVD